MGHPHVVIEGEGWTCTSVTFLLLWYFWSACTLFLNKYVVFYMKGDPTFLSCSQMWLTLALGYLQLHFPLGMFSPVERKSKPTKFKRNMIILGGLRFCTVFLGIVALNFIEVSFTETIKSSAPAFTVLISRILLGEVTGLYVNLSLLPIMGGLALCTSSELSYNLPGFLAALGTNLSECLQNVFTKMLVSADPNNKYSPAEIQFYTSIFSIVIQVPVMLFMIDFNAFETSFTWTYFICCILNGISFHFQTMSAFALIDFISPVTHSVANTVKRALLIWFSVMLFGNEITPMSGLGTIVVILGVLVYNRAREVDLNKKRSLRSPAHGYKGRSFDLKEALDT